MLPNENLGTKNLNLTPYLFGPKKGRYYIPSIPKRIKEWAYAGFAFDFIFATISHGAVDGFTGQTFFPLIVLGILAISYIYYYKLDAGSK